MKAESSVIWNRGINLTAITRRRDARTVLITKKQKTKGGLSREKSQARETAVLYTSSMDIKERCPYVYADTECLYDNSLDDCLIRLHNDECDGVITQADILRLYKYNHMKDYIYDYIPTSIYVPETGEAMSAVLTSTDADIIDMVSRVSDENAVKCINIESDTIQSSFAIAGALVIFVMAIEMLLGVEIFRNDGPEGAASIVPIVFPLIAGAGSFTTLLSLRALYGLGSILAALFLNILVIYVVIRNVHILERALGKTGVYVLRKFFGIILLALSVRMFLQNLSIALESF